MLNFESNKRSNTWLLLNIILYESKNEASCTLIFKNGQALKKCAHIVIIRIFPFKQKAENNWPGKDASWESVNNNLFSFSLQDILNSYHG